MSVPGRTDAAALLLSLDPPTWHLRHSRAVAEVAGWLAARLADDGRRVDRGLVEAAALLHDVDKLLARGDPLQELRHGDGSAAWLAMQGHPELADVVASHPVSRLADDRWWAEWRPAASLEGLVVAYADKRAGQRLESLAVRFDSWRRRFPPSAAGISPTRQTAWSEETMRTVRVRAEALERDVCRAAGVLPAGVRRLAWTRQAIRSVRLAQDR